VLSFGWLLIPVLDDLEGLNDHNVPPTKRRTVFSGAPCIELNGDPPRSRLKHTCSFIKKVVRVSDASGLLDICLVRFGAVLAGSYQPGGSWLVSSGNMAMFILVKLWKLDDVTWFFAVKMNSSEHQSPINVQNVSSLLDYALKSTYKARDADSEVVYSGHAPFILFRFCGFLVNFCDVAIF